jgi:hypothetical protein
MRLALVLVIGVLGGMVGACKGDAVECEKGCRNYATLTYWKNAEAELAKLPADQRDARRKTLINKFTSDLEGGIDVCVSQCQSANNPDDIKCLTEAKTAERAAACLK